MFDFAITSTSIADAERDYLTEWQFQSHTHLGPLAHFCLHLSASCGRAGAPRARCARPLPRLICLALARPHRRPRWPFQRVRGARHRLKTACAQARFAPLPRAPGLVATPALAHERRVHSHSGATNPQRRVFWPLLAQTGAARLSVQARWGTGGARSVAQRTWRRTPQAILLFDGKT